MTALSGNAYAQKHVIQQHHWAELRERERIAAEVSFGAAMCATIAKLWRTQKPRASQSQNRCRTQTTLSSTTRPA
jgi:hypothetical protein